MRPKLNLLSDELVQQVTAEGFELPMALGVRVHNQEALKLLADAGASVDAGSQIARIPESVVRQALATAPSEFYLYTLDGEPVIHLAATASSSTQVRQPSPFRTSCEPNCATLPPRRLKGLVWTSCHRYHKIDTRRYNSSVERSFGPDHH